jgi:hypothetical protein
MRADRGIEAVPMPPSTRPFGPVRRAAAEHILNTEVIVMFTPRNLGGVALFLAGTTWLWLTPAFAAKGVSTSGALWGVTRILCFLTIAVFCVATWGLIARQEWWEAVAIAGAVIGLLSLVPYWIAATDGGEATGAVAYNSSVHVVMAVGVFVLLLVPKLEQWVSGHVMSG